MDIQPWPSETPDQVRLTKAVWAKSTPRLIILDDVIDGTHLQSLIRELPDAHILVTSRCENWSTGLPVADRDLDQMPPEEARSFLRRVSPRLTQTSDKDLDDLTTTLGGLPLALYLAGCYLNDRSNLPVAGYLQQISKAETLLKEREYKNWTDETFSDHSNSLLATFEVSWEMLEEKPDAETAKPLFQICGYCSPSVPIPHEFIESIKFDTDDKKQVILAIRLLKSVGLVESADQDILIHPLLAEFARLKDSELDGLEYASNSYGDYSYKILASGDPRVFTKHLQHIQQIAKYKEMSALNGASRLWSHLGLMNKDLANFDDSKANFERALHIDKQAYGKNHPSVATRLNNLGGVNKSLGNLLAAKSCLEQAVIIDTNFYGKSHPIVANDLNNLGNVLIAMDDLPAAKANLEKALTIDVQFYGEEHHTVANRLSNIGSVLQAMGDPLSAKINFEKALAIDIKWYGEEHTEIATDLNNLGSALRDLDDFITAKTNITQALILDIKFYGKSHPTVAIDLNNLGTVLQDLGNLPAAKANFEKALEILKTKLPPNHPTIHIVQNNLNLVNQQIQAQKELNE
jgi:tetratricopeptide (TPR) repeat protein